VTRPRRLVVVTGTGTEVGKTWVAAYLASELAGRGFVVAARKPVQSFAPDDGETDADVLAAATGGDAHVVCAPDRSYEIAMAPPMAAEALGRPAFTIADLAAELVWPEGVDAGLVEGAGGPRSPLASDGDTVDLARALDADAIVLVADAGLGTINAVRLAHPPLAELAPVTVVLNRYDATDDLHARNRQWLADRAGFDVTVTATELADHLMRPLFGSLTARRG
jgi:dethiobiotin synthetase